jgi:hypothetical protein
MDRTATVGWLGLLVGLVAYAAGTQVAYPGRAFSLVLVMAGATLVAIGGGEPA